MAEYQYVEKPFLDQLKALGWDIVDQGTGIPQDPAVSFRSDFRQVVLKNVFKNSIRKTNILLDGNEWLTGRQLEDLYDEIVGQTGRSLLEANENMLRMLFKHTVDVNEVTGEVNPEVRIIDFFNPENNNFLAINQFRIDTPGQVKKFICPDIVLFVNGLPLIVVECKEANEYTSNPMHEAYKQLMRYSEQREETARAGLKEGEPRLFFTNQLLVRTCGDKADIGSITSIDEEFWYGWKYIPKKFREYEPPLGKERAQEILIQGLLAPETLLDMVRHCVIFMESGRRRIKIVARYQQYRALRKMLQRMRDGGTPRERSGVIWHTQGSGKSLTMVFMVRKLRTCEDLKDFKVIMVNDRTDLETQLGTTASLTDEKVTYITSSWELKSKLASSSSNLNMVMVHKFREKEPEFNPYFSGLKVAETPPEYKAFGKVNDSERILIMIDEAHRTQYTELGDNLFEAFPNATRIAFTGTPLITDRHKQKTWQRFGNYIDKYKLQDAVDDGATIQILYEGKTSDTAINEKSLFDVKFENLFGNRTEQEINLIKKKYGTLHDVLDAPNRIDAIAKDLVSHYIQNILPNGFKAQVVCNSKIAAVRYKAYIDKAVSDYLAAEKAKPLWGGAPADLSEEGRVKYQDGALIEKIAFLKSAVVVSTDDTNELAEILQARKEARAMNAVENFKKKFDYSDPQNANTGIGFLIVCDMLLTGFDAPVEQVMYLDKKIKEHNLLQTIARVNRVEKGKSRGYIIDYIGLAHHLKEALSVYAGEDYSDAEDSLRDIASEIPVLESRYRRLVQLFYDKGTLHIEDFVQQKIKDPKKSYEVLEQAISLMEDIKLRSDFEVYMKKFMQSMDIILPHSAANLFKIPCKRFGYILSRVRERYKDDSITIAGAGEKVRKLINEHLISLGINPKVPPVELLSPEFIHEVEKNQTPRAKASEMEHAIRKHCKIHLGEDPAFYNKLSEKLEAILQKYKDDWDQLCLQLGNLREEATAGRKPDVEGVSAKEAPFYDLIIQTAFGKKKMRPGEDEKIKALVGNILGELQARINIIKFWGNPVEIQELQGKLTDLLYMTEIDDLVDNEKQIVTEITALAKARHRDLIR